MKSMVSLKRIINLRWHPFVDNISPHSVHIPDESIAYGVEMLAILGSKLLSTTFLIFEKKKTRRKI